MLTSIQNFVRADNLAFSSELEAAKSAGSQVRASPKRKADGSSSGGSWGGDPNYPIEPLTGPSDPLSRSYAPSSPPVASKYFSRTLPEYGGHNVGSKGGVVGTAESGSGGQEMKELGKRGFVANARMLEDRTMLISNSSSLETQDQMMGDSGAEEPPRPKHAQTSEDVRMK